MSLVVFDFDGTLVDTAPAFEAAVRKVFSAETAGLLSVDRIEEIVARSDTYGAIFDEFVEELSEQEGGRASVSADALATAFRQVYPAHGKLYPGVYRLLMALQEQADCAVVGSAPPSLLGEMVDYFGLDGYVAHTAAASGALRSVTDWLSRTESAADGVLLVTSHPTRLEFGRDAGMTTVFCAYGYGPAPRGKVDHRIERLSELFGLVS